MPVFSETIKANDFKCGKLVPMCLGDLEHMLDDELHPRSRSIRQGQMWTKKILLKLQKLKSGTIIPCDKTI